MFHIVSPSSVYDLINEDKIEINLTKGKESYDVAKFLDDISIWMDKHRGLISEQYLPFSFLSVGTLPVQISSFMFGLFVGKALEKHGLKIKLDKTHIVKDQMLNELENKMGNNCCSSSGEGKKEK